MHHLDIRDLDFNLLELFSTVMRVRSISEAARILDLPQSSASRGLSRLREALGDELFVRSARGMEPTTFSASIADQVDEILRLKKSIESAHHEFDPNRMQREFVIGGSDVGQYAALAALFRTVSRYPGVTLKTAGIPGTHLAEALEGGEIDLALGPYPSLQGNIMEQTIFQEHYMSYCRFGHPIARDPTLDAFLNCEHLLVSGKGIAHAHAETEMRLKKLVPASHIRIVSESYFVAMAAILETDLVLTMPANSIGALAKSIGLTAFEPPLDLPHFAIKQYWHRRHHDDPANRWLRAMLRQALVATKFDALANTNGASTVER